MNKLKTTRVCPVCGNNQGELLTGIDFLQFSGSALPEHYDIVACFACGFVYNDTDVKQADFCRYYSLQSKYAAKDITGTDGISHFDKKRFEKIINFMISVLPSLSVSIVDIGCAQGGLLNMLKEKGFHNLCGVDLSPACVEFIRSHGIEAVNSNLLDFQTERKFDVVLLTGVLEHIFDLQSSVIKLANLLSDAGSLLIEVPDASRYTDSTSAPFYRFDFEHINHFSLPHLQNLLGLHNFELISYLNTDNQVSENSVSPTMIAIFRKSKQPFFQPDFSLKNIILDYIHQSKRQEYHETINRLADSGKPILIWGLGAHAARMLKETKLKECNIVAFIDNDPYKAGKSLLGKPVYPSEKLSEFSAVKPLLVICSVLYSHEMHTFARKINYAGEVLCLT